MYQLLISSSVKILKKQLNRNKSLSRKQKEQSISLSKQLKRKSQRLLMLKLKQDRLNLLELKYKTKLILNLEELMQQRTLQQLCQPLEINSTWTLTLYFSI